MKFNSEACAKCKGCCKKLDTGKTDFRVLLSKTEQKLKRFEGCFDGKGRLFVNDKHDCIFLTSDGCTFEKVERPKECLLFPLTVEFDERRRAKKDVYEIWTLCPEVRALLNSLLKV